MPRRRARAGGRGAEQNRQHLIAAAARIMAEEGVRDYQVAKRKAAFRLNLPEGKFLPTNQEIDAALQEYLRLFRGEAHAETLRRLRALALEAMRFFERFDPRLVGALLTGAATEGADVQLHVRSDTPEEIGLMLQEHSIPYAQSERRMRFGGDRQETLPVFRFEANAGGYSPAGASAPGTATPSTTIELCVFTTRGIREPPLSPVDGKPMHRADVKELETLLAANPVQ